MEYLDFMKLSEKQINRIKKNIEKEEAKIRKRQEIDWNELQQPMDF